MSDTIVLGIPFSKRASHGQATVSGEITCLPSLTFVGLTITTSCGEYRSKPGFTAENFPYQSYGKAIKHIVKEEMASNTRFSFIYCYF